VQAMVKVDSGVLGDGQINEIEEEVKIYDESPLL
jgi:hypothetical protein